MYTGLPRLCRHVQVCMALSQVAKHSLDLAEAVVEADVFPQALTCLQFPDATVKSAACQLVRDVVKHSAELAQVIVGAGGVALIVDNIKVRLLSTCIFPAVSMASSEMTISLVADLYPKM